MAKIQIDYDDLEMALDSTDRGGEAEWYLDLRSGEVILVTHDWIDDEEGDDFPEWQKPEIERSKDIEANPSAYLLIEPPSATEDFQAMVDFTKTVKEGPAKDKLTSALESTKAFRQFRNTLAEHASVQAAWFTFKEKWLKEYVQEWLENNKLDAVLVKKNTSNKASHNTLVHFIESKGAPPVMRPTLA
jgi:hypothetical protein